MPSCSRCPWRRGRPLVSTADVRARLHSTAVFPMRRACTAAGRPPRRARVDGQTSAEITARRATRRGTHRGGQAQKQAGERQGGGAGNSHVGSLVRAGPGAAAGSGVVRHESTWKMSPGILMYSKRYLLVAAEHLDQAQAVELLASRACTPS